MSAVSMVLYPIPETALSISLRAWLATRDEVWLTGWTVETVWPVTSGERLIVVSTGTAGDHQVVDLGMLTVTVLGPAGDYNTTIQAAQYLKAALPTLTGNGIASISRVLGPTAASDPTGRPKRVLTANYITTGAIV